VKTDDNSSGADDIDLGQVMSFIRRP